MWFSSTSFRALRFMNLKNIKPYSREGEKPLAPRTLPEALEGICAASYGREVVVAEEPRQLGLALREQRESGIQAGP